MTPEINQGRLPELAKVVAAGTPAQLKTLAGDDVIVVFGLIAAMRFSRH